MTGIEGWIELKAVRKAPVRATTIVRCDHYTQEQRVWLSERKKAGGRVHLLVKVERTYFLFSSPESFEKFGKCTMASLGRAAQRVWTGTLNHAELIEELMR
jgi:hypothetical protein